MDEGSPASIFGWCATHTVCAWTIEDKMSGRAIIAHDSDHNVSETIGRDVTDLHPSGHVCRVWAVQPCNPFRLRKNLSSHNSVIGHFAFRVKHLGYLIHWEEHVCQTGYGSVSVGADLSDD